MKQDQPGYALGATLIAILVAFNVAALMAEPALRAVLIGTYLLLWGCLFLASYFLSDKTFFFPGLIWVCEHLSRPSDRRMAFFYFGVATVLGVAGILMGLGEIEGR